MKRVAIMWLLPVALTALATPPDYVITTVAGSDNVGDGGPAAEAFFSALEGVARGPDGSLYLADTGDHRVRRVTPDGVIHTIAGVGAPGYSGDGGPASAAALNAPYGLALDAAGRLFIADLGNSVVRVIQTDGSIATAAGAGPRLRAPRNVAIDPGGNLYVSEFSGQQVSRVNPDGSLTTVAGSGVAGFSGDGGAATSAALRYPAGIAFDAAGNLYIADSGNGRVRVVRHGICSTLAGPGAPGAAGRLALDTPTGIAVDASGNLYVAHAGVHAVWRIAPDSSVTAVESSVPARDVVAAAAGVFVVGAQQVQVQIPGGSLQTLYGAASRDFGNGGLATRARLGSPTGVAVDAAGRLAIADTAFDRLRVVDTGGIIASLTADVAAPRGLQFDAAGTLLVADSGYHAIQDLPLSGALRTLAGSGLAGVSGVPGLATKASIGDPSVMALDGFGNVYFSSAHRIFRLLTSGYLDIVAGTGVAGYNGDGGDATTRQLNGPAGLATDRFGNLYIADTGNHLLRRRTPDGALVTIGGALTAGFAGDGGPLSQGRFSSPAGLAVSAADELWIADAGNHRVRMVDSDGLLHTIAGTGVAGFSGDGGVATAAGLFNPTALAIAADGVVYVADTNNRRVRALTPPALGQLGGTPGVLAVVHAASGQFTAVAPGLLVSIYGEGLGPAAPAIGEFGGDGRLATVLEGTQVTFNGVAAPLLYVSAGQINAQVPYEVAASATASVEVQRNGLPRAAATVAVQAAAPGLFVDSANNAAALNPDGSVNGPGHVAPRGSIVLLF
ncbi:MAG TPA: hypothetical protein DEQ47_11200, partial [Solibacterales bacterium]|nr:hypothetical protein [Bryobacterales bacterium]